jgi:excisionase family DNA binding protein
MEHQQRYLNTSMPYWNFITNYGAVLNVLAQQPQITVREIASQLGITERTVLRIIAELEVAGYLHRYRDSRGNSYEINRSQLLGGTHGGALEVGELLKILASGARGETLPEPPDSGDSAKETCVG